MIITFYAYKINIDYNLLKKGYKNIDYILKYEYNMNATKEKERWIIYEKI